MISRKHRTSLFENLGAGTISPVTPMSLIAVSRTRHSPGEPVFTRSEAFRKFLPTGTTLIGLALLLALTASLVYAGDVVDRIVATVNGHIILQSDWDEAVAYEAFLDRRPLSQVTVEQRKAALDRLIDQELIREQARSSDFHHSAGADVDKRIREIRKDHPQAVDDASWKAALRSYTLSEDELRQRVGVELDELRAVDAHLRPRIDIDSGSVEAYYRDKLLPELRQAGARDVPLAEVAPKIKELLAQQKMNDLLIDWLRTLRSESNIRTPFPASAGSGGGGR